jgi:pseudaminic acid biosynthesis-associated methylase
MFKTQQEEFWAGDFGDAYCERNNGVNIVAANTKMFSDVISHTQGVQTAIEFGANIGLNLRAIRNILPLSTLYGVEINRSAVSVLTDYIGADNVFDCSILEFEPDVTYDMSLIKTVLIHINPDHLQKVYEILYRSSRKYILVAEYYNTTPVTVEYRGHTEKLYKRDFAGEILDKYSDLRLLHYGFCYHRDSNFPEQDDITWFLLEKV